MTLLSLFEPPGREEYQNNGFEYFLIYVCRELERMVNHFNNFSNRGQFGDRVHKISSTCFSEPDPEAYSFEHFKYEVFMRFAFWR